MLIDNQTFEKISAIDNANEYEGCVFDQCDLSEAYLTSTKFIECEFIECNLSNAQLNETSILDCVFQKCKMIGVQFDQCNQLLFSARFEG